MTLVDLVFYGVALVTVLSAAYAVFSRNIVRAVFSLLGTFFGVAVVYGFLAADFVAVVQLMVYVGGILVLLIFAVMLTSHIETVATSNKSGSWVGGALIGIAFFAVLASLVVRAPWKLATTLAEATPTTAAIGNELLGQSLLPFMTVSLLLMGAVVGAVTIARKKREVQS